MQSKNIIVWQKRFLWWNNVIATFSWDQKGELLMDQFSEMSVKLNSENSKAANAAKNCYSCGAKFSLFKRKYICKDCRNAYCSGCMAYDKVGIKMKDVCKSCAVLESI